MKNGIAVDIPIAEIIVHENYSTKSVEQYDDIALLRLKRSVNESEAETICLPFAQHLKDKPTDDAPFTLVGFGKTEKGNPFLL